MAAWRVSRREGRKEGRQGGRPSTTSKPNPSPSRFLPHLFYPPHIPSLLMFLYALDALAKTMPRDKGERQEAVLSL